MKRVQLSQMQVGWDYSPPLIAKPELDGQPKPKGSDHGSDLSEAVSSRARAFLMPSLEDFRCYQCVPTFILAVLYSLTELVVTQICRWPGHWGMNLRLLIAGNDPSNSGWIGAKHHHFFGRNRWSHSLQPSGATWRRSPWRASSQRRFSFRQGKGGLYGSKAVCDPEANFSVEGDPLDWFPGTLFQHENLAFVPSGRRQRIDQLFHRLPGGKLVSGLGDTPFRD